MLIIPQIPLIDETGIFVAESKTEFGDYAPDSDKAVYHSQNQEYTVTVNGLACPVRDCRVSAVPFNRPWPGWQRPFSQTESAGFITFCADEAVTLRVRRQDDFDRAVLRPLSKGVTPLEQDGELVFTLHEPGKYVLECDGWHHALHIFFDPIKEYPDAQNATYVFGPGLHFPGVICLKDNDSVYLDKEAVVFGSLYSKGAQHLRIFGGGVLNNCCEQRITEQCYENHTKGCLRLYDCTDVVIEDIVLTDSSTWALSLFGCKGVTVDNVKIVGQWRYNTDGIDLVNCSDIRIQNCFVRSFDDVISIKGIYDSPRAIQNITVSDCVLWCGWGHTCELGVETSAIEYTDIRFEHCDVIHTQGPALAIKNGNHARIHDIVFEDMRVEFQADSLPAVMQKSDAQVYDAQGRTAAPQLIAVDNDPFAIRIKSDQGVRRRFSDHLGTVENIVFRNISVHTDSPALHPEIRIASQDGVQFSDILLDGLWLNGQKQSDLNAFQTEIKNKHNFILK